MAKATETLHRVNTAAGWRWPQHRGSVLASQHLHEFWNRFLHQFWESLLLGVKNNGQILAVSLATLQLTASARRRTIAHVPLFILAQNNRQRALIPAGSPSRRRVREETGGPSTGPSRHPNCGE